MKRLALVLCVLAGCSKKSGNDEAYPVGLTIGGGSSLIGPSKCTYEAPAAVAKLLVDGTMAELVGEGEITEKCGDTRRTFDVRKPTAIRIDGPDKLKVGAKAGNELSATLLAGTRALTGIHPGNARPMWTQGDDCKDTAAFAPVLGAQDTGGSDITRALVTTKAGACTVYVELLGQRAHRTVTID